MHKWNILSRLDSLEYLSISSCNSRTGYLSKLNSKCSLSLKRLSYRYGTIDFNDINKIGELKVLEELKIYGCKFLNYTFKDFINSCKFFKSLKNLKFWVLDMKNDDLLNLKRFRKLKKLSFRFTEFELLNIKNCLLSLSISQLQNLASNDVRNYKIFCRYLRESNLEVK
ncbi:hypothetical protein CWI37_1036p0010 [Hamiltosporidium tvaerminnensis]|uniref:Leucine-rich repeat-containing protein n=1 Tax=Hamiltosporidium tvaerminnensis TaxID=1176355 RepID=A0A4Q9L015_9MICR|nr:hypothetical protein CWI37_1036p0010 [Hamiltosporidium tvaerminnensis]